MYGIKLLKGIRVQVVGAHSSQPQGWNSDSCEQFCNYCVWMGRVFLYELRSFYLPSPFKDCAYSELVNFLLENIIKLMVTWEKKGCLVWKAFQDLRGSNNKRSYYIWKNYVSYVNLLLIEYWINHLSKKNIDFFYLICCKKYNGVSTYYEHIPSKNSSAMIHFCTLFHFPLKSSFHPFWFFCKTWNKVQNLIFDKNHYSISPLGN